ncbi:hypothetical protein FRB95_001393 [Tulasnella sp. JGI-2019a]|nr:hypothetical protein FRB95_001393 [Tulasnella sp. JGI-2019a]
MQEDLQGLLDDMAKINSRQKAQLETRQPQTIHDLIMLNPKGQPREKRLAASREGLRKSSGGGAKGRIRLTLTHNHHATSVAMPTVKEAALDDSDNTSQINQPDPPSSRQQCGLCKQPGHNQQTCLQK